MNKSNEDDEEITEDGKKILYFIKQIKIPLF
jgi:hypothetical protein